MDSTFDDPIHFAPHPATAPPPEPRPPDPDRPNWTVYKTGTFPICNVPKRNLLSHLNVQHSFHPWTIPDLKRCVLDVCPCGQVFKAGSFKLHKSRSGCTAPASAITLGFVSSTPPSAPLDETRQRQSKELVGADASSSSVPASVSHQDPAEPPAPHLPSSTPPPLPSADSTQDSTAAALFADHILPEGSIFDRSPRALTGFNSTFRGRTKSGPQNATPRRSTHHTEPGPGATPRTLALPRPSPKGHGKSAARINTSPSHSKGPLFDPATFEFSDLAGLPPSYKPLGPAVAKAYKDASERLAKAYAAQPSRTALLTFLALPKIGLVPGLRHGQRAAISRLEAYPNVNLPRPDNTARTRLSATLNARRLVEAGRLGAAARALSNDVSIAPLTPETINQLSSLHPVGPFQSFGPRTFLPSVEPQLEPITADHIHNALKSFRHDSAPGLSGLTVPLLRMACDRPAVMDLLLDIANGMVEGTALGQDLLCAARLTPLQKAGGGIRPIAIGELIYRVCAKAIVRHLFDTEFLLPTQFGVHSKGGV